MVDEFEEKPGEGLNLQQYVDVIRRRHMYFLIPFFVGWLVVWSVSWVLPSRYKSGTLILVEQPSMPKDYVTPNVTDDLQARLQSITQQILSRTRLLHIIDELNLYADKRGRLNPDELVERMRKDIEIELVLDAHRSITSFNIYYSAHDPHVAQQVTGELTNLFISENLELRQQKSEDTTKFLEQQLETARQNLAEQEEKVRVYKDQHLGELPTQLTKQSPNLDRTPVPTAERRGWSQRRPAAERLPAVDAGTVPCFAENDQEWGRHTGRNTGFGPAAGKAQERNSPISCSHYTDRHPDVRKVKDEIARVEKMRDQALADLKTSAATTSDNDNRPTSTPDDLDSRDGAATIQLQGQLKANQIDMANKEHEIAALKAKINDYQGRLNQEPMREQQFADLNRGYEQSKANYDDLLKKKTSSQMATSMELLQQGEHFQMIDPPSLPLKPDFPNRLKFCGIGFGIGIALGGAACRRNRIPG